MSNRKSFSTYLLQKEILSTEDFVQIRVDQARQTPTALEIIYEHSLMNSEDLKKVLEHQYNNDLDFINSCKELHLWTDHLSQAISKHVSESLPPFSQYIVEKGFLDENELIHAIDDFLSSEAFAVREEAPKEKEVLKEDLLSDHTLQNLRSTLKALNEKPETESEEPLKELCQELKALSGALRMKGQKEWEELFDLLFETFNLLSEKKGLISEDTRKSVVEGCEKALHLFQKELMESKEGPEKKISEETKAEISDIQKGLLKDHFDLDMLFNEQPKTA